MEMMTKMGRNMSILGLVSLMILLVILVSGCAKSQTGQEKPKDLTDASLKTVVLTVEGYT